MKVALFIIAIAVTLFITTKSSYKIGEQKEFSLAIDTMQVLMGKQITRSSNLNKTRDTVTEIKFSDTLIYDFSKTVEQYEK